MGFVPYSQSAAELRIQTNQSKSHLLSDVLSFETKIVFHLLTQSMQIQFECGSLKPLPGAISNRDIFRFEKKHTVMRFFKSY